MNEPTTKEEALRLLDQLQSKFSISKRDIIESFNKSIEDSNNRTPNTKIRLITVDEAIFKIIIPWNKDKRWNNRKEDYPDIAFHDNRWFIYWHGNWYSRTPDLDKLNMVIRTISGSSYTTYGGFISEYNYTKNNIGDATSYQDNYRDNVMIRVYDEDYNMYNYAGQFGRGNNYNVPKNGISEAASYFMQPYRGFFPVISYSL